MKKYALLALLLCIGLLEPLAAFFRDVIALSGLSGGGMLLNNRKRKKK